MILEVLMAVSLAVPIEWDAVDTADRYRVYVSESPVVWEPSWFYSTEETSIEIVLPDEGIHYFQVTAVTTAGTESVWQPGERTCPPPQENP